MFLFGPIWTVLILGLMVFFWKMRSDEEFIKKVIKWRNGIQGIETKITPSTIKWTRTAATLGLIVGTIMLLMSF